MKLQIGITQIYTGDGKGKTTCAIGQGIRAAGRGLNVFMIQFLKSYPTGELEILKNIKNFKVFRFESPKGFFWTLNQEEKNLLKKEIETSKKFILNVLEKNECDVLILDELMGAIKNRLIKEEEVLQWIIKKPNNMELILTGRNAPVSLIKKAQLVSEISPIKHPFEQGISSREGIEF